VKRKKETKGDEKARKEKAEVGDEEEGCKNMIVRLYGKIK